MNCLTPLKTAQRLCYLWVKPLSRREQTEKSRIFWKGRKQMHGIGASVSHCLSGRARAGTPKSCRRRSLCFTLLPAASTHLGLMSNSVEIRFISCDCLLDGLEQTHRTQQRPQHCEERSKT